MSLWQGWDGSPGTPFWFFFLCIFLAIRWDIRWVCSKVWMGVLGRLLIFLFLCIFLVIQWVCGKVGMGRRNQGHKRKHSPPPRHENSVCGKSVIISFTVLCFKGCHTQKNCSNHTLKVDILERFLFEFWNTPHPNSVPLPMWIKVKSCPKADSF